MPPPAAEYSERPPTAGENVYYAHPPSTARSGRRRRRPAGRAGDGDEPKESMEKKEKRLQAKFFAAIRTSNIKPFKALLSHSLVGVNVCNFSNNSALHEAIRVGNRSFAMKLLQLGAEKDAKNDHGQTPMHIAAQKGYVHCVVMLISKGANMNVVDNKLRTPLHLAALYNQASTVKALLEREAIVVFRDIQRYTALHYASERGYKECVWYLLQVTPPTPVFTNAMPTPFRLAEDNGHDVCAGLIRKWVEDWRKERARQGLSLPTVRRTSSYASTGGSKPPKSARRRSARPKTSGPRVRRETIAHTRDAQKDYNRKTGWLKPLFAKRPEGGQNEAQGDEDQARSSNQHDDDNQDSNDADNAEGQGDTQRTSADDGDGKGMEREGSVLEEGPPADKDDDALYDNPSGQQEGEGHDEGGDNADTSTTEEAEA